jgi:hypothetical protein
MGAKAKVAPEGGEHTQTKKGGCCSNLKAKINGFEDGSDEKAAAGISPGKGRKCRDVLCLAIFGVFWLGMIIICMVAISTGDPYRLLYGSDYEGDACGGSNRADLPFAYYPRMNKDLLDASQSGQDPMKIQFYGLCVKECPKPGSFICNYPEMQKAIDDRMTEEQFSAFAEQNEDKWFDKVTQIRSTPCE